MSRHLLRASALEALRRGRGIGQLLNVEPGGLAETVTWVAISGTDDGRFELRVHHVRNEGSPSFFDVHEFSPVDHDEYLGEGRVVERFENADVAVQAAENLGAAPDRWVNQGVIDAEYKDASRY
jgi:hypothetical protein